MKSCVQLLYQFLKDRDVASLHPTWPFAVKKLCSAIDFSCDTTVVEYGPGTGAFTHYLLRHLTPHSSLIAIEQNESLAHALQKHPDPRLTVVHDSAENIEQIIEAAGRSQESVDYVVSGIPFSLIGESEKNRIVRDTASALVPGGKFLIYQWSMDILRYLGQYFQIQSYQRELINIPPLRLITASKRG